MQKANREQQKGSSMRKIIMALAIAIAAVAASLTGGNVAHAANGGAVARADTPTTPGYYHLVNYDGKCLAIPNGEESAAPVQYTCNTSRQQYWQMWPVGYYIRLKNLSTGECLTIAGKSTNPGAAVVQATCANGNPWEQWGQIEQGAWWPLTNTGDALQSMHPSGNGTGDNLKMYVSNGTASEYYWKIGAEY
jgi:hypothetical protein